MLFDVDEGGAGLGHCLPTGSGWLGFSGSGGTVGIYKGPLTPHPDRVIVPMTPKICANLISLATMIFILDKRTVTVRYLIT